MQTNWALGPQPGRDRHRWLFAVSLSTVSVLTLAAGAFAARQYHQGHADGPLVASAAVVLLCLTAFQWRIAWLACYVAPRPVAARTAWARFIVRWQLAGTVLAYGVGLGLGSHRDALFAFFVLVAGWYTAGAWVLVADRSRWSAAHRRLTSPGVRRLARGCYYALVVVVVAEGLLRGYAFWADDRLPVAQAARNLRLVPGSQFQGRTVNQLGYWDDEFASHVQPGVFRVAVLGGGVTLGGTAETNYLVRIEREVPGIEVFNFGVAQTGPREHVAQLIHEVANYRPDLILVCLSVDESITARVPLPGRFDWQSLRIGQFTGRLLGRSRSWLDPQQLLEPASGHEAYLSQRAAQLTLCRTPLDDAMRQSWDETLEHLDDLTAQCDRRALPLAVVLVPSDFQVNRQLCDRLRRRSGLEQHQLDLELPQRRLRAFADARDLPWLDLLPHLRAAPAAPFGRDDTSLNETGNRVAAEALGEWLAKRFGPQIAASMQAATP